MTNTTALLTKNLPIDSLKPSPHNARTHSTKQIRQIAVGSKHIGESLEQKCDNGLMPSVRVEDDHMEIMVAARFETYGRTQVAVDEEGRPLKTIHRSNYNPVLVNALTKSYRWNRQLENGEITITDLAQQIGMGRTYVSRIVNLMFLSPDIISRILTGTQPPTLTLRDLIVNLPVDWNSQKRLLNFPDNAI